MAIHFSTPKKQRVCNFHDSLYRELVRAYLHDWHDRADNLIESAIAEEQIKAGDADLLVLLAQDFVATHRMVGLTVLDTDK